MKVLTLAALFSAVAFAGSAFAADPQAPAGSMSDPAVVTQAAATDASTQAMPAAQPQGKTRADVFEELVRAEKSGELQRLNSTLYSN